MNFYKNRFLPVKIFVVMFSLFSFVFFIPSSIAQEKVSSESSVIEKLTQSVQKILDLLVVALEPRNNIIDEPSTTNTRTPSYYIPHCLRNSETWDTSNVFKEDADWSMHLIPKVGNSSYNIIMDQFIDLNGDGLVDYFYNSNMNYTSYQSGTHNQIADYTRLATCIMLNTGSGWEIAYRCVTGFDEDTLQPFYRGDCADMS